MLLIFARKAVFVSLAIFLAGVLPVFPQSRGNEPGRSNVKRNRRVEVPSPTPTPATMATDADVEEDDGEVISVDTRLVTIPVRVIDRKGRFVGGLQRERFSVWEEGTVQEIAHFSNEAEPFTVALMLDMSYSSKFKLADIQAAAVAFIDMLRPNDRVMVVSFAGETHVLCQATNDRKEIYRAIRSTKIETGTSLYEAVGSTMNQLLRPIEGRKAMVLFTDGVDTSSRKVLDIDNLRDAMELDALIYPIRYDTFQDVQKMSSQSVIIRDEEPAATPPIAPSGSNIPSLISVVATPSDKGTTREEYKKGENYLDQLALRTGGTGFVADTIQNLNNAFSRIASELREFYSISYYPSEKAIIGKTRKIKVRVDRKDVAVKTRNSYTVSDPAPRSRAEISK